MECRLTSGYCHCFSCIIDNNDDNEKTNVYERRHDAVCLTYSFHRTRFFCQQKKRKKKIAQSNEKEKDIEDRQLVRFVLV